MLNIDSIFKEFKAGAIERIFICFYAYFIVGYIILFTIYENNFINLELSTQIFLAIAISFPITTIPIALLNTNGNRDSDTGLFYGNTFEFVLASFYYSIMFILFYIVKHLEIINYNSRWDPVIGLAIILICVVLSKQ
jgi:predicted neutral ceramidase superfamily lipid hydrolase